MDIFTMMKRAMDRFGTEPSSRVPTWVCANCNSKIGYDHAPTPVRVDIPPCTPIGMNEAYDEARGCYVGRDMKIEIWCDECAKGLKRRVK